MHLGLLLLKGVRRLGHHVRNDLSACWLCTRRRDRHAHWRVLTSVIVKSPGTVCEEGGRAGLWQWVGLSFASGSNSWFFGLCDSVPHSYLTEKQVAKSVCLRDSVRTADKQADRQTDRHSDRQTDRQTHTLSLSVTTTDSLKVLITLRIYFL